MINLKTSIKTGVRDVLRGFLAMRPDIYVAIAVVYAIVASLAILVISAHGNPTPAEARNLSDALSYLLYGLISAPVVIAVAGVAGRAVARRTRWAHLARWPSEKYITVEEHEAEMRQLREDLEATVREELESQDGGDA